MSYTYSSDACLDCHPTGDGGSFTDHDNQFFPIFSGGHQGQWDQCATCHTTPLDRTIFEDAEIFATALHRMRKIDRRDWETYWSFYQTILRAIQPPDLLIYLRCPVRTLRRRIKLRGRAMEQDIPLAYLRRLDGLYENWIGNYAMSDVLVLETDKLD